MDSDKIKVMKNEERGFMKQIMGVYDADPFYADRFVEFANQKEQIPFTAVAFTGITSYRHILKGNR